MIIARFRFYVGGGGGGVPRHVFLSKFPPASRSGFAGHCGTRYVGRCWHGDMTAHGLLVVAALISATFATHYDVNTDESWQYVYYPLNETTIQFKVKAKNDAHVIFTETKPPNNEMEHFPYMEVVLGGWKNSQSAIRRRRSDRLRVSAQTPGIVSDHEFRGFWIKLIGSSIMVGREHESVPFLSWTDPNPLKITHFGVATAFGSKGQWKIDVKGYDYGGHESRCAPQDVLVARSPWDGTLLHIIRESCWSALTETSCNTVDEPTELSELPPAILQQASGSPQAPASSVAEVKPKKKRYIILADELKTWDEARAACEERGQRFASVKSEEEQRALEEAFKEQKDAFSEIWIAANDRQQADQFVWYDGTNTVLDYNNWQRSKVPSRKPGDKESCVYASALAYVLKQNAYWFTTNCDTISHFACEVIE